MKPYLWGREKRERTGTQGSLISNIRPQAWKDPGAGGEAVLARSKRGTAARRLWTSACSEAGRGGRRRARHRRQQGRMLAPRLPSAPAEPEDEDTEGHVGGGGVCKLHDVAVLQTRAGIERRLLAFHRHGAAQRRGVRCTAPPGTGISLAGPHPVQTRRPSLRHACARPRAPLPAGLAWLKRPWRGPSSTAPTSAAPPPTM